MAAFARKFESCRQDWPTPRDVFDPLHREFRFTLDAAASKTNALVSHFLGESDDALNCDWGHNRVWLNPPYGAKQKLSDWVRKAHAASQQGAIVVMLIPARTNTNWFHDYCLRFGEVRFVRGRPRFGDATHGLPQPLCVVVFRPSPEVS